MLKKTKDSFNYNKITNFIVYVLIKLIYTSRLNKKNFKLFLFKKQQQGHVSFTFKK